MPFNVPTGPRRRRLAQGVKQGVAGTKPAPYRPGAGPRTGPGKGPARPSAPRTGQNAPAQKPKPQAKPKGQGAQPDSRYYEQVDKINTHETEGLSNIAGEKQNVAHEFGIDDPTNPFSRAQGLKKAYLARRKAASAGLASQGQLYSGAHERALAKTRADEEQSYNELRTAYMAALQGLGEKESETKYSSEEERQAAFDEWLNRAPEADAGPDSGEDAAPPEKPKPESKGTGTLVDKGGTGSVNASGGNSASGEGDKTITFGKSTARRGRRRTQNYTPKGSSGPKKTTLGGAQKPKPKPKPKKRR